VKSKPVPFINNTYVLKKFPGKGGWTYALLKGIKKVNGRVPKIKVKGSIDDFPIKNYTLMPYRDGLFLPLRAEIRKKIGKQEGDKIKVVLYRDDSKFEVPEELLLCLKEEPRANSIFKTLSESEQRLYVLWIYSAKTTETRTNRIVKSLERLSGGMKLYEKK